MEKPITIRFVEFKENLESLINDSCLPPFIIEQVIIKYLNDVHSCAVTQYLKDKKMYEANIKNTMSEGDSDDYRNAK